MLLKQLSQKLSTLRRWRVEHGYFFALFLGIKSVIYYPIIRYIDSRFDKLYGTDTSGRIAPAELGLRGENASHAAFYEATPTGLLKKILRRTKIPYKKFTFIDIGSGKGRVLLIASTFPFKKIIGVELSPKLHAICKENVRIYKSRYQKCNNFELHCTDATCFKFPPDNLLLYMNNPFDIEVLEVFLKHLEESLIQYPRELIIVYLHPRSTSIFDTFPSFHLVGERQFYSRDSKDKLAKMTVYRASLD